MTFYIEKEKVDARILHFKGIIFDPTIAKKYNINPE